jgi:heme/copper-type cytochrome/quinol oxidase subunit 1
MNEKSPTNPFKALDIDRDTGRLLYAWVLFAVSSLAFAGIFAFLLAMARTPVVQDVLPGEDYFRVALVTHVNLAFVIWFLAFMGALWTITNTGPLRVKTFSVFLGWLGFWASALGTIFLVTAAFFGWGAPLLTNYVPVLDHPLFHAGLALFATGIFLTIINTFLSVGRAVKGKTYTGAFPLITYGMTLAGITVLIAFVCFGLAYIFLAGFPFRGAFFERLFWGGGHILQFSNTIAMIVAWILLTQLTLKAPLFTDRIAKLFLGVFLLFALPGPLVYLVYDIQTQAYKDVFTWLMEFGLGISTGLFILAIIRAIAIETRGTLGMVSRIRGLPWSDPGFSSLVFSVLLFIAGGLISLNIHGSNVKIPSHYHGVIGAVTLAFMGLTYHILPLLKRKIYSVKTAKVQPFLYGIGQMMFVLGMYVAGTEGVPRKTFGSAQVLSSYYQYTGMAVMGLGGLVATLGGSVFVLNKLLTLLRKEGTIWLGLPYSPTGLQQPGPDARVSIED